MNSLYTFIHLSPLYDGFLFKHDGLWFRIRTTGHSPSLGPHDSRHRRSRKIHREEVISFLHIVLFQLFAYSNELAEHYSPSTSPSVHSIRTLEQELASCYDPPRLGA